MNELINSLIAERNESFAREKVCLSGSNHLGMFDGDNAYFAVNMYSPADSNTRV